MFSPKHATAKRSFHNLFSYLDFGIKSISQAEGFDGGPLMSLINKTPAHGPHFRTRMNTLGVGCGEED